MNAPPRLFITGASSGIGEALAKYYAARGGTLGLAARDHEKLVTVAKALATLGARQVTCYPLDVADAAQLQAAAEDFITRHGAPDIVIANAGVSSGTLTEYAKDLAAFRRILETNVFGLSATFSPFIATMRNAAGDGRARRLVGIASIAGIRGLPSAGAYSASKAAAIAYLESLRVELRSSGIKIMTIKTPMTAVNSYPMPFLLSADEAAQRFARAIDRGASYTVIPWQMGIVAKVLRLLPNGFYDRLFAKAPRKPRIL